MGSFDLQPWTRIGAMNLGVAARRQTAAVWLGGMFAALCRDAATGPRFKGGPSANSWRLEIEMLIQTANHGDQG
jgi:hypothetical protein